MSSATFFTEAIVLQRYNWREFDQRISVYSLQHGLLQLVVRGAKRPKSKLAGHIEPISKVNLMVIKGKQYDYAGSAQMINSFSKLKDNYDLLVDGGIVVRMLKYLIKPEYVDDKIYYLLGDYLKIINSKITKNQSELILLAFILKFVSNLGYSPILDSCLNCKTTDSSKKYFFNYKDGGLLCESCNSKRASLLISTSTINLMRKIVKSELDEILFFSVSEGLKELKKILDIYVRYNLRYKISN